MPSVLLLFLLFYWCDNALPGKDAQSCTQHQPLTPGQGGEVWEKQRNSCSGNGKQRGAACSETISPRQSARGGLGARQGKDTRCCRAEKTIWMTLDSHPRLSSVCWSAVMLLKSPKRTQNSRLPWLLRAGLAELWQPGVGSPLPARSSPGR